MPPTSYLLPPASCRLPPSCPCVAKPSTVNQLPFGSADPYALIVFEGTAARTSALKGTRTYVNVNARVNVTPPTSPRLLDPYRHRAS